MRVIGITGGIGTGKSFILRQIGELGFPTYSADQRAKQLMEQDPVLRQGIQNLLGSEAYTETGELRRAYIAERIFKNTELREKLNQLIHPRTIADFVEWIQARKVEGHIAVFKEAALTLEAGGTRGLDALILVYAPLKVRIERLCKRDGLSEIQILQRMRAQWTEWKKMAYADFVIINDGYQPLRPQLIHFFNRWDIPLPSTFA
ncbi:MAG: dephospho-CoA kinase [Bacteroidia bacterium]|nr:dephospho-CoA kinase [Bacteroidia bacterium]MDW8416350.1 dephospho-CoA kinase [Bacteroidia bacterium]